MRGACAWKRPFKTARAEASTSRPAGLRIVLTWIASCSRSLWRSGGREHLAASCIHHGQRPRFDRLDRRDKSIFRLGRLWLLDILRRAKNRAPLKWCLPFQKQANGWRFSLRFSILFSITKKVSGREDDCLDGVSHDGLDALVVGRGSKPDTGSQPGGSVTAARARLLPTHACAVGV